MNTLSRLRGSLKKKSEDSEGASKEKDKEEKKDSDDEGDKKKKKRLSFFDSIRKTKAVGKPSYSYLLSFFSFFLFCPSKRK